MNEKNKKISFRVTETEYKNLTELSETAGISISDYIRTCVNNIPVVISNHNQLITETKKLTQQIYPIGNNLNQISKQLNTTGEVNSELNKCLTAVSETMDQAKNCYQKIGKELEKQTIKFNKKNRKGGIKHGMDQQPKSTK